MDQHAFSLPRPLALASTICLLAWAACVPTSDDEASGGMAHQSENHTDVSTGSAGMQLEDDADRTTAEKQEMDAMVDMALPDAAIPIECMRVQANILSDHIMGNHELDIDPTDIDIEQIATMADMHLEYNLRGMADHDHAIQLTPFHAKIMLDGRRAMISSTLTNGHSHFVELTCP